MAPSIPKGKITKAQISVPIMCDESRSSSSSNDMPYTFYEGGNSHSEFSISTGASSARPRTPASASSSQYEYDGSFIDMDGAKQVSSRRAPRVSGENGRPELDNISPSKKALWRFAPKPRKSDGIDPFELSEPKADKPKMQRSGSLLKKLQPSSSSKPPTPSTGVPASDLKRSESGKYAPGKAKAKPVISNPIPLPSNTTLPDQGKIDANFAKIPLGYEETCRLYQEKKGQTTAASPPASASALKKQISSPVPIPLSATQVSLPLSAKMGEEEEEPSPPALPPKDIKRRPVKKSSASSRSPSRPVRKSLVPPSSAPAPAYVSTTAARLKKSREPGRAEPNAPLSASSSPFASPSNSPSPSPPRKSPVRVPAALGRAPVKNPPPELYLPPLTPLTPRDVDVDSEGESSSASIFFTPDILGWDLEPSAKESRFGENKQTRIIRELKKGTGKEKALPVKVEQKYIQLGGFRKNGDTYDEMESVIGSMGSVSMYLEDEMRESERLGVEAPSRRR